MPVQTLDKDLDDLTMTVVSEFDAPVARVWRLWSDPRQLERWWGPPGYPATVVDFDLSPGGRVTYFMTSPEGEKYHGWWKVTEVDEPNRLAYEDGFGDDTGAPNLDLPVTDTVVTLAERDGGGTVMTSRTAWASREAMQQTIDMGVEEGTHAALGQIDVILAEDS